MARLRQITFVLTCVSLGLSARGWAEQVKVNKITCGQPVGQWAVDEPTGRIFASAPVSNVVIEYDPGSGKELRQFDVPENLQRWPSRGIGSRWPVRRATP